MKQKKKDQFKSRLKINVDINEDIEFELKKLSDKRKVSISRIVNEILQEWIEDQDMAKFDKKEN